MVVVVTWNKYGMHSHAGAWERGNKSTAQQYAIAIAIAIGIEKSIAMAIILFPSSYLGMHICVTNILLPAVLEKLPIYNPYLNSYE